ncbi:MAG TPA: amidohydrolase family protein [Amycolatopsis sp.]|nr:amidohydrolase family protein [Amycolatopsis sp.]
MRAHDSAAPTEAEHPPAPSLLLRNVRVGSRGPLGNVLIADGRVEAITLDTLETLDISNTPDVPARSHDEVLDGGGRTLLPGLWDAHVHMVQWASARRRVDLSGARSARGAAATMAAAAADKGNSSTEDPLIGYGFRDGLWPDKPEPSLLEWRAYPERVVALVSNDLHTAWLNRAALHKIGYPNHPTGVLREHECFAGLAQLSKVPSEIMDRWVAEAVRAAAARGVTGFLDFESDDNLTDWRRRANSHTLQARVTGAVYPAYFDQAIEDGLRTGDVLAGTAGLVTVGPLKVFVDGSLNTRTALCHQPYPDQMPEGQEHGLLETAPLELERLMARAKRHGLQTAVHAIGDKANGIALDAFDKVGCAGRIEHAQLIDRGDVRRFARPGLVLGVQPAHATDDRDVADRHWAGRTDRAFAYADLLGAGASLEIGSDAPVSPLDPWQGIASAVARTGTDGRAPWHPEQRISVAAALAAASAGRRSIRVGEPADLVLCEEDPALLDHHELREMPIFGTLLAGRWTHRPA